jgi:hypothetical protein
MSGEAGRMNCQASAIRVKFKRFNRAKVFNNPSKHEILEILRSVKPVKFQPDRPDK